MSAKMSSMLTKLDLNNRTQIALLAHDAGLTSCGLDQMICQHAGVVDDEGHS